MDTELFNEKTIKRLCSNVKVSNKQKKNANDWIKLLESGSLEKERTNYFRFAIYILRDILGYSIREDLDYEKANIEFTFKDSIGKTVLCIEAKGGAQDLFSKQGRTKKEQSTPFKQTWDNMGRIDTIKYGICTNYRDFILIDKSKGYSKYHFFDFLSIKEDPEKLKEFIAIFSKESIIDKEFIEKLYEKSIIEEREFTKEFYKLFHETRLMLIKELQDNGATKDESIHFTQIFLNRLMFVFFAEDTGKLRQRLFEEKLLNILKADSVFSENTKLVCTLIKSIFQNLNEGSKRHNIFGFNGGLFKEIIPDGVFFKDFRRKTFFDEIYQNSKIKKDIELDEKSKAVLDVYNGNINPIIMNLLYLASFDFNSEVSVNILGHIFEQSISDLENIKEEKVLRRKKEGVYYTPDYITDYICRNTIITYLSKKGVNTVDKLIDEYSDNLEELETKFKNLKILDPACGSGSFLLKAVEILLEIHKEVQILKQDVGEYTAKKKSSMKRWQKRGIKGDSQLTLVKWKEEDEAREIIENNIYGVDINEESVEITKLSLFFKIVKKNKKLIDLSNNIKCGNSLIDDSEIAGDKVFKWEEKFKEIMNGGGFDLIIGNPPYVFTREKIDEKEKEFYYKEFETVKYQINTYVLFIEKTVKLLKKEGKLGFIIPDAWLRVESVSELRKYLLEKTKFEKVLLIRGETFEGVGVESSIFILNKTDHDIVTKISKDISNLEYTKVKQREWLENPNYEIDLFEDKKLKKLLDKLEAEGTALDEIALIKAGLQAYEKGKGNPVQTAEDVKNRPYDYDHKFDENTYRYLEGKEIERYSYSWGGCWLRYGEWLAAPRIFDLFSKPRLLVREIPAKPPYSIIATYLEDIYLNNRSIINILQKKEEINLKYILGVLNSKLITFYHLNKSVKAQRNLFPKITLNDLRKFPIKEIDLKKQEKVIEISDKLLRLYQKIVENKNKFLDRVKHNLKLEKITKKMNYFYENDFPDFLKELKKQKINLSLIQQDEWDNYFNQYKNEILNLQDEITKNEKIINQIVYDLYCLSKEEIDLIEKTLKN